MLNGLRQKTVVQPNGTVMIQSSELPLGETVEVIVLVDLQPSKPLELPLANLIGTGQTVLQPLKRRIDLFGWNEIRGNLRGDQG